MLKSQTHQDPITPISFNSLSLSKMIHDSSSETLSPHSSHPTFPFIAVAIIGIFATIFLLVFYYIFVIKCCHNWHRIDILRRFSLSRTTDHHHHPLVPEPTGLHESVIRSIPVFHFQKQKHSDNECAVCLAEFQHDEKLRIIPNCAHVFHIDCIDVWLQSNPNCPLCRNSISISQIPVTGDYVVIDVGEGRTIAGGDCNLNSGGPGVGKIMEKLRQRYGYDSSMGDECIGANSSGKLLIQPLRRSVSMDSAMDQQLYSAVQEIRNSLNNVIEVNDGCRLRRGLFSFGHARTPFQLKPLN